MPILYDRQIRTSVAGLTITDLRQSLSIERHSDPTQDRGSLAVYNLAPAHEARMAAAAATIRERGDPITVEAGYPDTIGLVFEGEVQRVIRARERTARITRITLGDQVRHKDRLGGVSNRVYPGVESTRQIARDLVLDMGLVAGPLDAIPESATFTDFHWAGFPTADGLRALLNGSSPSLAHLHWFEADGVVRFSEPGKAQMDAPTIALTPETGLIESPVVTDEGASARMFLNPTVVLGCWIDLTSANLNGRYKVVALRHTADNWQGEFETGVDLREEGANQVTPAPPPAPEPSISRSDPPLSGGSGRGGSLPLLATLDPSDVRWLHTDVRGWPVTSHITDVTIRDVPRGGICISHTQANRWQGVIIGTTLLAGNPWVFVEIDGQWYGATYEWLRPGQICKFQAQGAGPPSLEIGPHTKRNPISRWVPKSGETLGFMVSTPARSNDRGSSNERSQIVLVRWP